MDAFEKIDENYVVAKDPLGQHCRENYWRCY